MLRRLLPVLILLAACSSEPPPEPPPEPTPAKVAKPAPAKAPAKVAPKAEPAAEATPAPDYNPAMLDASLATEEAPATYTVKFVTSKGDILIDVTRAWAPKGADRFYNLVKIGYFTDIAMFRVISGFMAQFGVHGDPNVAKVWRNAKITDDEVVETNAAGTITFATAGPNTRTTQLFMNLGDNGRLDGMGFAPFGKLRSMDILNQVYSGYGEGAPSGRGPAQGLVQARGNAYLKAQFPQLDYILSAELVE